MIRFIAMDTIAAEIAGGASIHNGMTARLMTWRTMTNERNLYQGYGDTENLC